MGDLMDDDVIPLVRKYALQNALEYGGKGQVGSTLGRLLSERQDLRPKAKDLMSLVSKEVVDANKSMNENGADHVRREIENIDPSAVNRVRQEKNAGLKPLENTEGGVVLRFAPNPNGPLSLGHSRGVVINKHYVENHDGKIVLRFDDTDTVVKPPLVEAYDWIIEDFEWLTGSKPDISIKASERMPIYLKYAEKLLSEGYGYVCECSSDEFKKHRMSMVPCPHRNRPVEENLELWGIMIDGGREPGDAIIRVKTDMSLPNPALRDWPAWRIQKNIHPLVGDLY
ncbi:MAG: glutamate--tRNA ligase family protein, partial [Candidatus Thermoplasmatota archaeon]|nr:glutamate--tRNA ligase family protein [Candidatus Thermoplasmatota archaeon]